MKYCNAMENRAVTQLFSTLFNFLKVSLQRDPCKNKGRHELAVSLQWDHRDQIFHC